MDVYCGRSDSRRHDQGWALWTLTSKSSQWKLAAALLIAGALLLLLRAAKPPDTDLIAVSKSRFLARSERMFRLITRTREASTSFSVVPARLRGDTHAPELARVQIYNDTRESELALDWDIETGELIRLSNKVQDYPWTGNADLGKAEAVKRSLNWLTVLDIASTPNAWKLDSRPELVPGGLYFVQWSTSDRKAAITLHAHTGELSSIEIRPNLPR